MAINTNEKILIAVVGLAALYMFAKDSGKTEVVVEASPRPPPHDKPRQRRRPELSFSRSIREAELEDERNAIAQEHTDRVNRDLEDLYRDYTALQMMNSRLKAEIMRLAAQQGLPRKDKEEPQPGGLRIPTHISDAAREQARLCARWLVDLEESAKFFNYFVPRAEGTGTPGQQMFRDMRENIEKFHHDATLVIETADNNQEVRGLHQIREEIENNNAFTPSD